jgi:hypothetical protein
MHYSTIRRISPVILLIAFLAISGMAQDNLPAPLPNAPASLTNADVVKMVKAGVPESVIVRTIQISEPSFSITPDSLIALKHQHVPDNVMAAMVDRQAAPATMGANAPAIQYTGGQPHTVHIHQLPNLDVAIRVDSKTTGKVEIRKNKIKVEKAGVPLFTVSWKVNEDK